MCFNPLNFTNTIGLAAGLAITVSSGSIIDGRESINQLADLHVTELLQVSRPAAGEGATGVSIYQSIDQSIDQSARFATSRHAVCGGWWSQNQNKSSLIIIFNRGVNVTNLLKSVGFCISEML